MLLNVLGSLVGIMLLIVGIQLWGLVQIQKFQRDIEDL